MTAAEIFSNIVSHQTTGLMFHDNMIEYFSFLNLKGFETLQKYQYFSESAETQKVKKYFMYHYNKFIPEFNAETFPVIPKDWSKYTRFDVDKSTKEKGVKNAFEKWKEWEHRAKKLYEKSVIDLVAIGEIAAAEIVKALAVDVDNEIFRIEKMQLTLQSVGYDIVFIEELQDSIFEEYSSKLEEIAEEM